MPRQHEHVNAEGNMEDLSDLVHRSASSTSSQSERDEARTALGKYPIIDIVKSLGAPLLSDDSGIRRQAVSTISSALETRSDINEASIPHIIAFLCSRLTDWASVEPSVQGIKLLYSKHITPSMVLEYPTEEPAIQAKERSDLSLMLGHAGVADLPPFTGSIIDIVLMKLLINVHAPSFGQQVRLEVLQLLGIWASNYTDQLLPIGDTFVKGLAIEGEDERDIACLSAFFHDIDLLFESGLLSEDSTSVSSKSVDDLFETLKSYFPIQLSVNEKDPNSLASLKALLCKCLVRLNLQSIEFLTPQLNDPSTAEDAYLCLEEIGKTHPNDLIPFILAEWNSADRVSTLMVTLWQRTMEHADNMIVEAIIARLVESGEPELLAVTARTNNRILVKVLAEFVKQNKDVLQILNVTEIEGSQVDMDSALAFSIIAKMYLTSESLRIASKLVPSITDAEMLGRIAAFVNTSLAESVIDSHVELTLVNFFSCHLALAVQLFRIDTVITTLVAADSAVVGSILLALFRAEMIQVEYLESLRGKWILALDAFADPGFCAYFQVSMMTTGRVAIADLPAEIIGALVVVETKASTQLIRASLVDGGRLELVRFISVDRLAHALSGMGVWEDLLAAAIGLDESAIVTSVAVAAWIDGHRVDRILDRCKSDSVWADVIRGLLNRYPDDSSITLLVVSQNTPSRMEALFASEDPILTPTGHTLIELLSGADTVTDRDISVITRVLSALPATSVTQFASLAETLLPRSVASGDMFGFKLMIKFLILTPNVSAGSVLAFAQSVLAALTATPPPGVMTRFCAVQTLAVMTEVVPSGKLKQLKSEVLRTLSSVLGVESRLVVRKQAAVAITNWMNVPQ